MTRERSVHSGGTGRTGPWASPDGVVLVVASGESKGKIIRSPSKEGAVLRIGKSPQNDVVLVDKTVSRRHAELTRERGRLVLRDLQSRNGTHVAGARVDEIVIEPGLDLAFGNVHVFVRVDAERAQIPPSASHSFDQVIGESPAMRRIFALLERVAPTSAAVLVAGDHGVGKKLLARSIHAASPRRDGPFEIVDCGAIGAGPIESELFGHEKGAFAGATDAHEGAFERAAGGTLVLDAIGELPLAMQPKLVRVLETGQARRVGGKRPYAVDARIVATAVRDLEADAKSGRFVPELLARLSSVYVTLPPLREREEDVPLIAEHLLTRAGDGLRLSSKAMTQLRNHTWPGNVRELREAIDRAAFLARTAGESTVRHVALGSHGAPPDGPSGDPFDFEDGVTYREAHARMEAAFERRFVTWLLGKHRGNVAVAARAAKMDRKYLAGLARKHRA